jgi:hypothetical protein
MNFFTGPLGGHRNYLTHIALSNCVDYVALKTGHQEQGDCSNPAKYKEFRHFLNAVESLNNILDYYFYEYEETIPEPSLREFKEDVHFAHPELKELSELANAYKHCVRENKGRKQTNLPWARDLQFNFLSIHVNVSQLPEIKVAAEYNFEGPTCEHSQVFDRACKFWFSYHNDPTATLSHAREVTKR